MKLEVALEHALNGNAMLFVGSGFSVGAKPLEGEKFLTGKELARRLYEECKLAPPDDDLYYAAQRFRRRASDNELVELLQRLFTAKAVAENHKRFSEIRWQGIFTTNYDDVIETAFKAGGKKLIPITIDKDTNAYTSRRTCCVHINGYIDDLTPQALDGSFKLTNTSYLTEQFSKSNWSFVFRRALEVSRSIIFVGYSMYDIDIARILHQDETLKAKTIFIERADATPEQLEDTIQNDFGTVMPIGMEGLWQVFDQVKSNFVPETQGHNFFSFSELRIPEHSPPMRDDDAFDFLLKGEISPNIVWNGANHTGLESCFVAREQHQTAMSLMASGERVLVISSDMANGKSAFALGIGCSLIARGYRLFILNENNTRAMEEINAITSIQGKVAVLIENYSRRFDEIKYFALRKHEQLILLLTAKTVFHETQRDRLGEIFGEDAVAEISLDKLTEKDIRNFSDLFTSYKLWGENDAWPVQRKHSYIRERCGSELSACLLGIVKSPEIAQRFQRLFEAFGRNDDLSRILITSSVLKLIGYDGTRAMVCELLNSQLLYSLRFQGNGIAKEVFDLTKGKLSLRSSVLAQHGLSNFADTRFLIDHLIAITRRAHDLGADAHDNTYFDIYVSLVNYGVVQAMIPERGKRDALIRFYEGLRNLRSAASHPHFWLQYALARLAYDEEDDLIKAKLYLDASYSHAMRRPGYHTRHHDNVLARYYLKVGVKETEPTKAFQFFTEAHTILLRQSRTEKTVAPYKVARGYNTFYNAKKSLLSSEQRDVLANASSEIVQNIIKLPEHVRDDQYVQACGTELNSMIADIFSNKPH